MHVIFIKNYRKKLVILAVLFAVWLTMFLMADFLMNNSMILNVTINNCLTFSHPLSFEIDNIYVNEAVNEGSIATNYTFKEPSQQKFSTYTSLKGKFSFNYPSAFHLNPQDFAGSDILYHIDFQDREKSVHGFVQVWNLPYPLKEFLKKSKEVSELNFTYFDSREVTVNDLPGYTWDYVVTGKDGRSYKGLEVFLSKANTMYRVSYFTPEENWNKTQSNIFWSMVKSFKVY